jgi:LPS export ABC transporter protein LptC
MVYQAKSRLIRAGRFLCLLIPAALAAYGCENDIARVKLLTDRKKTPLQEARNIEIIYSDSAAVKVQVTAPLSERFELPSPYVDFSKGVKARFYGDSLKVKSTLTANQAVIREKERKMEARGNVVVVNEKGEQLNSEHLVWDESTKKIYTREFVKITTPDKIIFGEGFEANEDFSVYRIFNIKGTIHVNTDATGS